MIFDLTDDDRGALERHRIRLGLRSHAETLRALIRGEPSGADRLPVYKFGNPEPVAFVDVRAKAPIPPKASLSSVPFAGDVKRAPMQKTGKTKR